MLPSGRSSRQPLIYDDKENTTLDYETSSYFPSSSSSPTSGASSGDSDLRRSPIGSNPFRDVNNNTFGVPSTYLNSISDRSQSNTPHSSGYQSSWSKPPSLGSSQNNFLIFKDESSSFDSMLSSFKSFQSIDDTSSTTQKSRSIYSPLSSFNFADRKLPTNFYSDFNIDGESPFCDCLRLVSLFPFTDLSSPLDAENQAFHDALRHDFEMNGKTVDMNDASTFSPSVSSTPMTNRRSFQCQQQLQHKPSNQEKFTHRPPHQYQEWSKHKKNQKKRFKPNKKSLQDVRCEPSLIVRI